MPMWLWGDVNIEMQILKTVQLTWGRM